MSRSYKKHLLDCWTTKNTSNWYNRMFRRINKVLIKLGKDPKHMYEIVNPWDIQDYKHYWRKNKEKCTNRRYAKYDE